MNFVPKHRKKKIHPSQGLSIPKKLERIMKKHFALPSILGICLGFALGALLWFPPSPEPDFTTDTQPVNGPNQESLDDLRNRIAELEARNASLETQLANAAPPPVAAGTPSQGAQPALPQEERQRLANERMKQFAHLRSQHNYEQTKLRLQYIANLTPEQLELVDQIYAQYFDDMFSPQNRGMVPLGLESGDPFRERLIPVLSPDQLASLDTYLEEQNWNRIEQQANAQLMNIQSQLVLSENQKDAIFQHYVEAAQLGASSDQPFEASYLERLKQENANTLAALEPILDPDQYDMYEAILTQREDLMETMQNENNLSIQSQAATIGTASGVVFGSMIGSSPSSGNTISLSPTSPTNPNTQTGETESEPSP